VRQGDLLTSADICNRKTGCPAAGFFAREMSAEPPLRNGQARKVEPEDSVAVAGNVQPGLRLRAFARSERWFASTNANGPNQQTHVARTGFKFSARSSNKSDGTAISAEHRTSPLVVGAGNAST
jgi:hypothetical protein